MALLNTTEAQIKSLYYPLIGRWKNCNQGHCISLKGQGLAQLIVLVQVNLYQISLPKSYCSKQKLPSFVISIIPKFLAGFMQKMSMTKIKLFRCDLCELWIHIKCKNLNYLDYRYLQNCNESWYCIECLWQHNFSFQLFMKQNLPGMLNYTYSHYANNKRQLCIGKDRFNVS